MKSRHYPIHLATRAEIRNKTATSIRAIRCLRSAAALGALGFALVFARLPSLLEAQTADTIMQSRKGATSECRYWDVGKRWGLKQSDGNFVSMELSQGYELNLIAQTAPPTSISGIASYEDKGGLRVGTVKGTVLGNKFNVRVTWRDNKDVGHWDGTILPNGIMQGTCSSEQVRSYKATFVSDRPVRCVPPGPQQVPTPKALNDKLPK